MMHAGVVQHFFTWFPSTNNEVQCQNLCILRKALPLFDTLNLSSIRGMYERKYEKKKKRGMENVFSRLAIQKITSY